MVFSLIHFGPEKTLLKHVLHNLLSASELLGIQQNSVYTQAALSSREFELNRREHEVSDAMTKLADLQVIM